jgi:phosphate transport system substrate-binding protein
MHRSQHLAAVSERITLAALISIISVAGFALDGGDTGEEHARIIIRGSSNLMPFVVVWADAFSELAEGTVFSIESEGTSEGLADLLAGRAQVAMASRSMNEEERLAATRAGLDIRETVVARMGIAVIVAKGNPIGSMTTGDLAEVFSEPDTNWQTYGGPDHPITVVRKDSGWSPGFFRDRIMEGREFTSTAIVVDSKEAVVAEVGSRPWAIGFTGMPEAIPALDRVALVRIVSDTSNSEATYALSRPLYLYSIEGTRSIEPFLAYAVGPEAQEMIVETGFYPADQSDAVAE